MEISTRGPIVEWRGPAPFLFLRLPPEDAEVIQTWRKRLTYGWGCIPVEARIGATEFRTSLIPRDGSYLLPLKVAVRTAESLQEGDVILATLRFADPE